MNNMSSKRLTDDEIVRLLSDYNKREIKKQKEREILEKYRSQCKYFKKSKCSGSQTLLDFNNVNGCRVCKENATRDLNNGMPVFGTKEYDDFEKGNSNVHKNFYKQCPLKADNNLCSYKTLFSFCCYCDCTFNRQR